MPEVDFLAFDTKRDPLDLLVIVESSIDVFGSRTKQYKEGWADWAQYYYNNFIKNVITAKQKFALFLLGSNGKASNWVNLIG